MPLIFTYIYIQYIQTHVYVHMHMFTYLCIPINIHMYIYMYTLSEGECLWEMLTPVPDLSFHVARKKQVLRPYYPNMIICMR
jgi:hypothetical protein